MKVLFQRDNIVALFAILLVLAVSRVNADSGGEEKALKETPFKPRPREDPCSQKRCSIGKECIYEGNEAKCVCIRECTENSDIRRRVCSNMNDTWQSDCHLFRHKCMCNEELSNDCLDGHKTMKIDYYGQCQALPSCTDDILEDFPRRMSEWLHQVMTTRMKKPEVGEQGNSMVSKWVDAVIWKFCDLDKSPHDRVVSTDELFPLRAPFLSMEPCIGKFLELCDPNNDQQITLIEWGQCLDVPQDEMEDKCTEFIKLSTSDE